MVPLALVASIVEMASVRASVIARWSGTAPLNASRTVRDGARGACPKRTATLTSGPNSRRPRRSAALAVAVTIRVTEMGTATG